MVAILEHLGVRVHFPPGQTCCGQAHYNSGYWDDARRLARHFVKVFDGAEHIVSPSGSCCAMVRHGYPGLLAPGGAGDVRAGAGGPGDLSLGAGASLPVGSAAGVGGRVYEFSEFLVNVLGCTGLGATFAARAVYHASCHTTRLLHAVEPPLRLLGAVQGLELVPLPGAKRCCGFGGTFAVKSPEISVALADDKLDSILATGASVVVSSDTSCLLHLMGRARRRGLALRFLHLAELLAEGMGLLAPEPPQSALPRPVTLPLEEPRP